MDAGLKALGRYQEALFHLEGAERKAQRQVDQLMWLADQMNQHGWKAIQTLTSVAVRFPSVKGEEPGEYIPLPDRENLYKTLAAYQSAIAVAQAAWAELPEPNRIGIVEPEKFKARQDG